MQLEKRIVIVDKETVIQNIKNYFENFGKEYFKKEFDNNALQDKLKEYLERGLIEAADSNIGDFIIKRTKLPRKLKKKNKKNKVVSLDVICKQSVEYVDVVVEI